MSKELDLELHILKALKYKSLFGQGLTKYQIIYFCQAKISELNFFEKALDSLESCKKVFRIDSKYYLSNNNAYKNHQNSKSCGNAQITLSKAEKYLNLLSKISLIKFIGVTGSLSSYFYDLQDDVDLFIITKKNRIWISRFLVVLLLKTLNVYVHQPKAKLRFCPNLYISSDSLEWEQEKRNLYSAHEILMMQPVYDDSGSYARFLFLNQWVTEYFPNFIINQAGSEQKIQTYRLMDLLENSLMKLQMSFMKKPSYQEVLTSSKIHFLVNDHSKKILEEVSNF